VLCQDGPARCLEGLTESSIVPRLARPDLDGRRCHDVHRRIESVELLVAVADLDALCAAKIDLILTLVPPGRVQESHQLLGGLDDGLVSSGAGSSQRLA
jgi:hypothetical protein